MTRRSAPAPLAVALVVTLAACGAAPATTTTPSPKPDPMTDAASPTSAPTTPAATGASPTSEPTPTPAPVDPLLAVELTDVRSGETFTLAELAVAEGPVLLQPMAVWCTSCLAQHREVVQAHAGGDFTSVSLDVDLTESPEDLATYADREGFDWRFAMADAHLYRLLQERFTPAATNPPSTPLIVVETDGTVRPLEFGVGVRSAEQLLAELGGG